MGSEDKTDATDRDIVPKAPNWRRRIFWIAVLALFIPIPTGDGLWMPILFIFFDWMNRFLPENF